MEEEWRSAPSGGERAFSCIYTHLLGRGKTTLTTADNELVWLIIIRSVVSPKKASLSYTQACTCTHTHAHKDAHTHEKEKRPKN